MTGTFWLPLRRASVPRFVEKIAETRAPEFARQVTWPDIIAIAKREKICVQLVKLPGWQRARLVRLGRRVYLQVNRALTPSERTVQAVHELVHFWRDDPGVACYYSDNSRGDVEEFADIVAWFVTSPARIFVDLGQERS